MDSSDCLLTILLPAQPEQPSHHVQSDGIIRACSKIDLEQNASCVQSLDGKHTIFGEIAEDEEGTVDKINHAPVDTAERPLQNIRIRRTEVRRSFM